MKRVCPQPDCHKQVDPTMQRNIAGHYTPAGAICQGTGRPFDEAIDTIENSWLRTS